MLNRSTKDKKQLDVWMESLIKLNTTSFIVGYSEGTWNLQSGMEGEAAAPPKRKRKSEPGSRRSGPEIRAHTAMIADYLKKLGRTAYLSEIVDMLEGQGVHWEQKSHSSRLQTCMRIEKRIVKVDYGRYAWRDRS